MSCARTILWAAFGFLIGVVILMVVLLFTPSARGAVQPFHYYDSHYSVTEAKVCLDSARVPSKGHTAVWLGAGTSDAKRWIQAGIAEFDSGAPQVYFESERGVVLLGSIALHQCISVALHRDSGGIFLTVNSRRVGSPEKIVNPVTVATAETYLGAKGTWRIIVPTRFTASAGNRNRIMAENFCVVIGLTFGVAGHKAIPQRCEYVRWDASAYLDLYRVWITDRNLKTHADRMYFICMWADTSPETAPQRVARVGQTKGVLC